MGEESKVYKVMVGMSEGIRPLGRPSCRREDGIRMDLGKIGVYSGSSRLTIGTGGGLL
jgi:hypothetical protein